jgi:hypothetical protein
VLLKLADVVVDISVGEPGRQGVRIGDAQQDWVAGPLVRGPGLGRGVAAPGVKEPSQPPAHVGFEFDLRDAFRLESRIAAMASKRTEDQIPLLTALRKSGNGDHLVHVIRAILDGEASFSLSDQKAKILSRIIVLEEEIQRISGIYSETPIVLPDRMTARDIGIFLDVRVDDIPGMIGKGCLKSAEPRSGRFVDGQSV